MNKQTQLVILSSLLLRLLVVAQIPNGYYTSTAGKTGAQLKTALHHIIKNPNVVPYSGLYNAYQTTDSKPNGKVWDMYSDNPTGTPAYEYSFTQRCGNYNSENDCFNREHSFPQSWFGSKPPMQSDLFHVYPTDGYVNNKRSNFPFGRVGNVTWTSTNGSKLGTSNYPGYSGTVFEPIDAYKGDFARTYFYMVTCYEDKLHQWSAPILTNNTYPAMTPWQINLFWEWHNMDPVSQKEIDRNNAVYAIQGNRNPFIDHPQFVGMIWGLNQTVPSLNIQKSSTPLILNGTTGVIAVFTMSGIHLTGDINVQTTNTNTSFANINMSFSNPCIVSPTSGTITNEIIYLKYEQNITESGVSLEVSISGNGLSTQVFEIYLVSTPPVQMPSTVPSVTIHTPNETIMLTDTLAIDTLFTISGENLWGPIHVSVEPTVKISTTNQNYFTHMLTINPTGQQIAPRPVYIKATDTLDAGSIDLVATVLGSGITPIVYNFVLSTPGIKRRMVQTNTWNQTGIFALPYKAFLGNSGIFKGFVLSASGLSGHILLTTDGSFGLSADSSGRFLQALLVTVSSGVVRPQFFFMKSLQNFNGQKIIQVNASSGSFKEVIAVTVSGTFIVLSISEKPLEESKEKIRIFPNPVHELLHIDAKNAPCEVDIYNCLGELIAQCALGETHQIHTETWKQGLYVCQIRVPSMQISRHVKVEVRHEHSY